MIIVTRAFKVIEFNAPLKWIRIKLDGKETARMTCVNGHAGILPDHNIDENGIITPSVQCTECDFHEMVTLEGWSSR